MSSIPNNAMPHAAPAAEAETAAGTASPTLSERAAGLAELVRDHPKTAIAAGAVLAAGAAAIPLARARSRGRANGADTGGGSGSGKSKKS